MTALSDFRSGILALANFKSEALYFTSKAVSPEAVKASACPRRGGFLETLSLERLAD